jgi:hypothetical protein
MTETENVSKLSKLLEQAEEHVVRCDELDPWSGVETRAAFADVCSSGAALLGKLSQVDPDIIGKSRRLKGLSQLELAHLQKAASDKTGKDAKQRLRTWGQALEVTTDLKDAAKFCASLADEKKRWTKKQDYRSKFKEGSGQLAGYLLYELLAVLGEYDAEQYPHLRLQVLCSYLKELRIEFLWDASARGPCRRQSIPEQCKFEDLPKDLKGELAVLYGPQKHEFTLHTDAGQESQCHINNTGIRDYRALLDTIWDAATGKLHSHPKDGSAVWAIRDNECVHNLEAYASLILKLLQPLSAIPEHGESARAIRPIIRRGRGRWTKRSHIEWPYLADLDKLIAALDDRPKQHERGA